ncbi:uncharacterized protein LOC132294934 [Cornus florida]|uniref:uncharacterized protein LOC132294934 n=1 Tax=Cornus florida TaxID=4283 RepID=UPI00289AC1CC|nr:uncharacterized protein LOC132294934 [Cornus florida]
MSAYTIMTQKGRQLNDLQERLKGIHDEVEVRSRMIEQTKRKIKQLDVEDEKSNKRRTSLDNMKFLRVSDLDKIENLERVTRNTEIQENSRYGELMEDLKRSAMALNCEVRVTNKEEVDKAKDLQNLTGLHITVFVSSENFELLKEHMDGMTRMDGMTVNITSQEIDQAKRKRNEGDQPETSAKRSRD